MHVEIALCQIRPAMGDPEYNIQVVTDMITSTGSDVLVFPECFLTGYGADVSDMFGKISAGLSNISNLCRKYDKAVAIGTPMKTPKGIANSIAFLSPDGDSFYDKTHLARFGIYSEDGYVAGHRPVVASYHGIRFGLSICYDIYFPEVLHACSLNMADVNICVSAAAVPSAPFFERILPARALENVTYLAFVNNVGPMHGLEMAGGSKAFDPLGNEIASCGQKECVVPFDFDTEALAEARRIRRHLVDFRRDIDWLGRNPRIGL